MLPGTVKVGTFHVSQACFDLKDFILKSIKFINDNGGFTVQGWLKSCIINDRSLLELESSGGKILPTNHDIIAEGTELFNSLNDLKYD
eukprot:13210492-Ditylum_brightwellii.AAC.1